MLYPFCQEPRLFKTEGKMLTPDFFLVQIREGKTEVSSSIPMSATQEHQGQQGGTSQHNTCRKDSKHLFHKSMSTKSCNNLSHFSKAQNRVLREQTQSYY